MTETKTQSKRIIRNNTDIVNALNKDFACPVHIPDNFLLPPEKVSALLTSVDHHLSHRKTREGVIVHFTSAYAGEGAQRIAFETGYMAAARAMKNVLFLNGISESTDITQIYEKSKTITLNQFLKKEESKNVTSPLIVADGASFFYASLGRKHTEKNLLLDTSLRQALFKKLRTMFDLIIIASESALTTEDVVMFSAVSDSTIIIIEAERTRIPVVRKLQRMIQSNGGSVMGSVLNKHRHYIPHWLYALLFKS